jgi:hypothetical protein
MPEIEYEMPPPKRLTGRTGNRRLTDHEVAQRDPVQAAHHKARFGQSVASATSPLGMPPAPTWLTATQRGIWQQVVVTAPPTLLHACDYDNLLVLVAAIDVHRRIARELSRAKGVPPIELVQQLAQAGNVVGRSSRVLGLNPAERSRIGVPVAKVKEIGGDAWAPFPVVSNGESKSPFPPAGYAKVTEDC